MGRSYTGSKCLFVTRVSGSIREPVPPASTIPFVCSMLPYRDVEKTATRHFFRGQRLTSACFLCSLRSLATHFLDVKVKAMHFSSKSTPRIQVRHQNPRFASVLSRYRFHQKPECLLETGRARHTALEMSKAHDDQLVGRDDQRGLATGPSHVVRLLGNRERAVAVYPEEAAVNGTLVGFPGRRHLAHELDVPLGQYPLAVPHAVLQIEVAETRPVACRHEIVSLSQKVAERVRLNDHRPDANLVEQRALREREVFLAALLDRQTNEVIDQHRIAIVVAPYRSRRPLQRPRGCVLERIDGARVQV